MYTHNECVVVYRRVLNAGSSAVIECDRWRHCRIPLGCSFGYCHLTPDNEPRQTCFRSAPQDSFANRRRFWYVSQKEMRRNEGPVPFISSEGYRALHSGRKALIVSNIECKGESELLRSDCLPPPHLGDTFGHPRTPNDHP